MWCASGQGCPHAQLAVQLAAKRWLRERSRLVERVRKTLLLTCFANFLDDTPRKMRTSFPQHSKLNIRTSLASTAELKCSAARAAALEVNDRDGDVRVGLGE